MITQGIEGIEGVAFLDAKDQKLLLSYNTILLSYPIILL